MAPTTTDDTEAHRWELRIDGDLAVTAAYRRDGDRITFTHTVTEEAHRGEGLARQLVSEALAAARSQGLAVIPQCPYVRKLVAEDPDLVSLVPEGERARFDL